jgi:hypothetical protein
MHHEAWTAEHDVEESPGSWPQRLDADEYGLLIAEVAPLPLFFDGCTHGVHGAVPCMTAWIEDHTYTRLKY